MARLAIAGAPVRAFLGVFRTDLAEEMRVETARLIVVQQCFGYVMAV